MKKSIAAAMLFMLMFSNIAGASYSCLDSNTSLYNSTITVSGSSIPISYQEDCALKGGCNPNTGQCYPSPYDVSGGSIAIMFSILILGMVFFIWSMKTPDEVYKIFFTVVSLLFFLATLLIDVTFVYNLNVASSMGFVEYMLWAILAALFIFIAYMFIGLILDLLDILSGKRKLKK